MKAIALVVGCLLAAGLLAGPAPARAADCDRAKELAQQAYDQGENDQAKALLQKALRICPNFPEALNNLGVIHEKQGDLDQAEKMYLAALKARPGFLEPLAGLGDVAFKRGDYQKAAAYYRRFLEPSQGSEGYFSGRMAPDEVMKLYRERLEAAETKAGIFRQSTRGVVGREYLVRGMTTRGVGGVHGIQGVRQSISLSVLFAYDSAELTGRSQEQLMEMVGAMNSPEMAAKSFRVVGHTDSFGPDDYNLQLSMRRAQAVRSWLVAQGVEGRRLEVEGAGETRLVVPGGSREEQALNRRVEFVVY